jgi:phosphatidylinositol alpha-1,6-mannosyltransferase
MRLLILSTEFPPGPGGIGTHAFELAQRLQAREWQVRVVASQDHARSNEIEAFNRNQSFSMRPWGRSRIAVVTPLQRWAGARSAIAQWRPDLLLGTGDRAIYIAAALAWRARLPWVAVEHGRTPRAWESGLKRLCLERADAVVCVSRYTRSRMMDAGVRPKREHVIPNGGDSERFHPLAEEVVQAVRKRVAPEASHVLLTVGNVTHRKGQDVVIRSLPRVLSRFPGVHYLIAGLPSRESEFRRLAQDFRVERHVHFLGRVSASALTELLNACDLFLMTSRSTPDQFEGFGIAAVEAALCGRPAIVTKTCGLAEAVLDGETGVCVPEEDETATAEAVIRLLGDVSERTRMGEAARRRALASQTWTHSVAAYDELFQDLARRQRQPVRELVSVSR